MNRFSTIIVLFLAIGYTLPYHAQKGYAVISKAEQKFSDGQYKSSLRLLNKARKMDYGFCGNAYFEVFARIDVLKAKISMEQGEYQKARNILDSIYSNFLSNDIDSMRIRSFQYQFGKEEFKTIFRNSLDRAQFQGSDSTFCFVVLPLPDGNKLKLYYHPNCEYLVLENSNIAFNKEKWKEEFLRSSLYKLIEE